MDYKDIQQKSETELHNALAEARNELRSLRFKVSENQLKQVRDIRKTRLTIARVLTALKKRQSADRPNV